MGARTPRQVRGTGAGRANALGPETRSQNVENHGFWPPGLMGRPGRLGRPGAARGGIRAAERWIRGENGQKRCTARANAAQCVRGSRRKRPDPAGATDARQGRQQVPKRQKDVFWASRGLQEPKWPKSPFWAVLGPKRAQTRRHSLAFGAKNRTGRNLRSILTRGIARRDHLRHKRSPEPFARKSKISAGFRRDTWPLELDPKTGRNRGFWGHFRGFWAFSTYGTGSGGPKTGQIVKNRNSQSTTPSGTSGTMVRYRWFDPRSHTASRKIRDARDVISAIFGRRTDQGYTRGYSL